MFPNFRSMQGTFVKAYQGTSNKSDAAGGEKAVKDAPERVFRHALIQRFSLQTGFSVQVLSQRRIIRRGPEILLRRKCGGIVPGRFEHSEIIHQIGYPKFRHAALLRSEEIAGAAQFQVAPGNFKAVIRLRH